MSDKAPTVFISYAHKDDAIVLKIIKAMQDEGFNIWYDKGIEAGTEWPEYIAENIYSCDRFVAFMSENYMASHNCRREVNFAIELKKEILVVYLEDVELTLGMRMQLNILQAIFRKNAPTDEAFIDEICNARMLECCKTRKPVRQPKIAAPQKDAVVNTAQKSDIEKYRQIEKVISAKSMQTELPPAQEPPKPEPLPENVLNKAKNIPGYTRGDTVVEIPYGITKIGVFAFEKQKNITKIFMPDSINYIDNWAFASCKQLQSINIPSGVKVIGHSAFYNCSGLPAINIPYGVEIIGDSAFHGCSGLTSIDIPESVTVIEKSAFYECKNLKNVNMRCNIEFLYDDTFCFCRNLEKINIPNSVISIGKQAFAWCEKLERIVIPYRATTIGKDAFWGCENLTSIEIPDSVTNIGKNAFMYCKRLVITCSAGSYAEQYAKEHNINVRLI